MMRSLLFIPGNLPNMIQNAYLFDADAIIFDLEDAVLPSEKDNARNLIKEFLTKNASKSKVLNLVRVNEVGSDFFEDDLMMIVSDNIDAIVLPKAKVSSVHALEEALTVIEQTNNMEKTIKIIPIIEQAISMLQVDQIASLPRVIGLILGGEDLTKDLEVKRTSEAHELLYSRSRIIMACAAFQIISIDTPYTDVYDDAGFEKDTLNAVSLGMKAKCAIHPRHIEFINQSFSPSVEDIEHAYKVLEAKEKADSEGKGSFTVDGKMVDKPIVERAMKVIEKAKKFNLVKNDEE